MPKEQNKWMIRRQDKKRSKRRKPNIHNRYHGKMKGLQGHAVASASCNRRLIVSCEPLHEMSSISSMRALLAPSKPSMPMIWICVVVRQRIIIYKRKRKKKMGEDERNPAKLSCKRRYLRNEEENLRNI